MFGSIYKAIVGASVSLIGAGITTTALMKTIPEITPSIVRRLGWSAISILGVIGTVYGYEAVTDSYKEIKGYIKT